MKLTVRAVTYTPDTPIATAWGTLTKRETLRVRVDFPDGLHGEGEAAPLEPYDGVSLAAVQAALDAYAHVLAHSKPTDDLLAACKAERDLPQALAAIDLALWDHASKRTNLPLAKLIDPRAVGSVNVNATIGAADRATAARAAAEATSDGFRCLKVKVGIGDDAGRLAAIRAAVGPDVLIRVDANGAWSTPGEALANLRRLHPIGIELCEEPIHGVDALRVVARDSPIPIAMDETNAPASGATPLVCLKISRGGISQVLADARAARGEVYLASTFDGPLGLAAAVHTAAALRIERHCGLTPLSGPRKPVLAVPSVPGLA